MKNILDMINKRIDQLHKCLANMAEIQFNIDDYNWAEGRKEQIKWELEFLQDELITALKEGKSDEI